METLKLIACDLDGTLLLNGAQDLSSSACELITRLQQHGILFVAASGRQYTNLQRLFWPIHDQIGYICENGCLSFYRGRMVHQDLMDRELGRELIQAIQEEKGAEVLVSGVMKCYVQPKDMRFYHHMRDVVRNDVEIVQDILESPEPLMKVSLYREGGVDDEERWKERFGDRCTVVTGGNEWLDMMPLHVSKASALARMLDQLDITPEECMAIGDNENDRELLEFVGLPAAVTTAKPEILTLSKYRTDTVEELFGKILSCLDAGGC